MTITVIGDNTGNDFAGTEDTHLHSGNATTNYGTGVLMEATKYNASNHIHTCLSFSGLSNIAGPVTVNTATLSLYMSDSSGTGHVVSLYRLLRNWVEAQATWNIFSTANNWQTAGGLGANDRSGTLSTSATVNTPNGYKSWTGTQLNTDTADFINGTVSNYGWHLERTDGANDLGWRVFRPSDHTDTQRPYLTVDHSPAASGQGRLLSNRRNRSVLCI